MMKAAKKLANISTWWEHNVLALSMWMKLTTMGTGVKGWGAWWMYICRHESCWISRWQHFSKHVGYIFRNMLEFLYVIWQSRRFWLYWFPKSPFVWKGSLLQILWMCQPTAGFDNSFCAQQLCGSNSSDVEGCTSDAFVFLVLCVYWRFPLAVRCFCLRFMYLFKSPWADCFAHVPIFFKARSIRSQEMGGFLRDKCSSMFLVFLILLGCKAIYIAVLQSRIIWYWRSVFICIQGMWFWWFIDHSHIEH